MHYIFREKIGDAWFSLALNGEKQLVSCSFSTRSSGEAILKLLSHLPLGSEIKEVYPDDYSSTIFQTLRLLYDGRKVDRSFPLFLENLPPFSRKALEVTMKIPRRYVTSYGKIAKKLGNKGASRAVGRAEATNPFPLLIPCHRVVKSTLELGEYGGGKEIKHMLLEREEVIFIGGRVSRKSFWTF